MEMTRRNVLGLAAFGAINVSIGGFASEVSARINADNFVLIKGGSFKMGSPTNEFLREKDESVHDVALSDFFLDKYCVTQSEYESVMGNNPSEFKGEDNPVENVTWYEAVAFCNRLSVRDGFTPVYSINGPNVTWNRGADGYRLPTEAEWEYAARAGTKTPFYTGENISADNANWYGTYPYKEDSSYGGIARERTLKVGSFSPNPWG